MKKSLVSTLILLFIGLQGLLAQSREVSGVITSAEDGLTIPGVSVIVKGTTIGTSTDFDGKYTINLPDGESVLIFSCVGMVNQEITVTGSTLNVVMENESIGMDEVMVVAYGTQKRSAFTGSMSTVDSKSLKEASTISPIKGLQGTASGVVVSQTSGQPGAAPTIRIRGVGSINGSKSPLYVIDGIPVLTGDYSTGQTSTSVMNMINSEDIESFNILKDAAATALYGSRGANGVVIITTKAGKAGKTKVTVSAEFGTSDLANKDRFNFMDGREYAEYAHEALTNYYLHAYNALPGESAEDQYDSLKEKASNWAYLNLRGAAGLIHPDDNMDGTFDYANMTVEQARKYITHGRTTNWRDIILKKGSTRKYDVTLSGGNQKTKFYTSLGYLKQEGISKGSSFERFTGVLNLSTKVNDLVSYKVIQRLSHSEQEGNITGKLYYVNPMFAVTSMNPTSLPEINGELNPSPGFNSKLSNPLIERGLNPRVNNITRSTTNGSVKLQFTDYLSFESNNSLDFIYSKDRNITSPLSKDGLADRGSVAEYVKEVWNITTSNLLKFTKSYGDHNVIALAGFEYKNYTSTSLSASGVGFASPKLLYLSNASAKKDVGGGVSRDRLASYLSKVDYDYKGKYFLSGSFRRDGSSRLAMDNKWGNFYAGSVGWIVSEEDFMNDINWLDFFKVKGSYGVTGNLPTEYYGTQALYGVGGSYMGDPVLNLSQMENKEMTWEKSYTWNAGFDFRIFGKVSGTFEWYKKTTKGLINDSPLLPQTGFTSFKENRGKITNEGIELEITSENINSNDFKWSTSFNLTHYVPKVKELQDPINDFPYYYGNGDKLYTYKLREWGGINPDNGKPQWVKNTPLEDGKLDKTLTSDPSEAEKIKVGDANPDFFGGITNRFSYKGIELSFLMLYRVGGKIYDQDYLGMTEGVGIGKEQLNRYAIGKHWSKPGDQAEFGRLIYSSSWTGVDKGNYNSSRRLTSGDYLKLKNITIGYNLPKSLVEKIKLENVKVYFNATDLYTWAKRDHIDYEVHQSGLSGGQTHLPPMKTFRFGVNVNF